MIEVLIPTCNEFIYLTEALQLTVRQHWDKGFTFKLLGYNPPEFALDDNWQFMSMGKQRGVKFWSNDLIDFLKNYEHEHFIFGNDDCCLTYYNSELLLASIEKGTQNKVGRFGLTEDGIKRAYTDLGTHVIYKEDRKIIGNEIVECKDYREYPIRRFYDTEYYRTSICWSIFSRKFFLEYAKPGQDPWMFEKQSCGEHTIDTRHWDILSFTPAYALDAAYFRQKSTVGIVDYWDKGYFGNNLEGEMREKVKEIIFK